MNMKDDWDDEAEVVFDAEENDEIEKDEDWGKFHGDRLLPTGMEHGVSYDDLRLAWVDQHKVDSETKVKELENTPMGLAPYRFVWDGDQLHQADAVAALKALIGNDLDEELSLSTCVFGCKGTTDHDAGGNESTKKSFSGGGCIVFIRRRRQVYNHKKVRYVFATDGGVALKMVADLEAAPLAGLMGSMMGYLVGDSYMKTFEPRRRNLEIGAGIAKALNMSELRVEVRSQKKDGEWCLGLFALGAGSLLAAANRKLKKGVTVLLNTMNTPFKLASGGESVHTGRKKQQETIRSSMVEEIKSSEGRRIKVYKLRADAAENAELQAKVTEQLEVFGKVESATIRPSKDGCAWLLAVYATTEAAAAACADDAIAEALDSEDLADEQQGFCKSELCIAENDIAYLERNKKTKTKTVSTYLQAANGEKADVDAMLAGLLKSEQTTQCLLSQVVNPTVRAVKNDMVKVGRKVVQGVTSALQIEVEKLRDDLAEMKGLLEAAVVPQEDGLKRRKQGVKGAVKRSRSRTAKPVRSARAVSPSRAGQNTPASAVKAARTRSASGARVGDGVNGASRRMLQALYANQQGAAIVAQMVNAEDQAALAKMFDHSASDSEEDEDDEEIDEGDYDMMDEDDEESDEDVAKAKKR